MISSSTEKVEKENISTTDSRDCSSITIPKPNIDTECIYELFQRTPDSLFAKIYTW